MFLYLLRTVQYILIRSSVPTSCVHVPLVLIPPARLLSPTISLDLLANTTCYYYRDVSCTSRKVIIVHTVGFSPFSVSPPLFLFLPFSSHPHSPRVHLLEVRVCMRVVRGAVPSFFYPFFFLSSLLPTSLREALVRSVSQISNLY